METLKERIEKTNEVVDTSSSIAPGLATIMLNQVVIMEALMDIKKDLSATQKHFFTGEVGAP